MGLYKKQSSSSDVQVSSIAAVSIVHDHVVVRTAGYPMISNDVCFRKMAHETIPAIITDSKAVQPFTKYFSVPEGKLVSILLIWVDLSSLGRAGPHVLSVMRL